MHWGVFTLADVQTFLQISIPSPGEHIFLSVCLSVPCHMSGASNTLRHPGSTEWYRNSLHILSKAVGPSLEGKHLTVKIILSYSAVLGLFLYLILIAQLD